MNKEEVIKLANECDAEHVPEEDGTGYVEYYALSPDELLTFANACEKIGMEKAAKICDSLAWSHKNAAMLGPENNCIQCANAIRKNKE